MTGQPPLEARVLDRLRAVPDFPSPGILFRDITPLLSDPGLFGEVIEALADRVRPGHPTHIVGIEARGFLFGAPLALALGVPFAPARKAGKLPWRTRQEAYTLEYRQDVLEMHEDAIGAGGARVIIVDDVLATGGTAAAVCRLVAGLGGTVAGTAFLLELPVLGGRKLLPDVPVHVICRG